MQTKRRSFYEALANLAIGFVYAVCINYVLLATWPLENKLAQSIWITFWFTLASLVRQYYMRRFFEWLDKTYPPAKLQSREKLTQDIGESILLLIRLDQREFDWNRRITFTAELFVSKDFKEVSIGPSYLGQEAAR